ncbi:Acyl transferase domain-containing protein [Rhizobiales bacterium GAS113]|nr:Acyl transferase domain-containing protein [Rhizobiales bacterium GAS113]
MATSMSGNSDIAVIGRACRLPGAPNLSSLWSLLLGAKCAVSTIPKDRWSHGRFFHPRRFEPGKTYTWAAGVLDDIWGFDPGVFGISPREAEQIDPQQRLALELVWEALEDAGLPPSSLAGKEIGVFVGASSLDYGNRGLFDVAAADAHFATGNTLSLISNRISYVFDLRGPSLTIDTACSSSLVALHQAITAIEAGQIDTAIVAGVNILASPFGFISFSQAAMLSPTGLCRAFDAKADGYVRAEGGAALVLSSLPAAAARSAPIFGMVVGSGVNSDGRTVGVSMPSIAAQADLLGDVYGHAGIDPNSVAFIEAHGTGTRVGDPAEAMSIGKVLGRTRSQPLPIGSIKTNIGHLEPAAGLAGVLKALLAFEHDFLPPSLHFTEPNPDIAFEEHNLRVCADGLALARPIGRRFAGVNSFGFGGTNAHVILSDPPAVSRNRIADGRHSPSERSLPERSLLLSAHCPAALAALASEYAARLERASDEEAAPVLSAAAHHREHLTTRIALLSRSRAEVAAALKGFAAGEAQHADISRGTAVERNASPVFVYSGNGGQWPGMGRSAYGENAVFRAHFDEVDGRFAKLAGWSLKSAMFDDGLSERLRLTSVAQPLLFAIQSAATEGLLSLGLYPVGVLGHSVGEVAAARAAGILDLDQALKIIHFRSRHQELARGRGHMAVLMSSSTIAERLVQDIRGVEIAAFNSASAVTISGTAEGLDNLEAAAKREGMTLRRLDLDYPFHSRLLDIAEEPVLRDLSGLSPRAGTVKLVSTVTGAVIDGGELCGRYWWRNIREPVRFAAAIRNAAELGGRVFIEIGPRPTLLSHARNTLEGMSIPFATLSVLDSKGDSGDPFRRAAANCWVNGARIDVAAVADADPGADIRLPIYPWQRRKFRLESTIEALPIVSPEQCHPLIGMRLMGDAGEWRGHLDPALLPQLSDHRIAGQILLPGSALVEMALAVARDWLGSAASSVVDLEFHQPVILTETTSREMSIRVSPGTGTLELLSRQRLSREPWILHATGKIVRHVAPVEPPASEQQLSPSEVTHADAVYSLANEVGLQFGPSFRQLQSVARFGPSNLVVSLTEAPLVDGFGLDPARLDSCFHGLIVLFAGLDTRRKTAFVPVRFGDVRLFKPGAPLKRAFIEVVRCDKRQICAHFTLLDPAGQVIAALRDVRFQPLKTKEDELTHCVFRQRRILLADSALAPGPILPVPLIQIAERFRSACASPKTNAEGSLLLEGWATTCAMSLAAALADSEGNLDLDGLAECGRLASSAKPWLACLFGWLEASKLAHSAGTTWRLASGVKLPEPASILRTLATEHPERSWELLIASHVTRLIERVRDDANIRVDFTLPRALLDNCKFRGAWSAETTRVVSNFLAALEPLWSSDRPARILQLGFGSLSHRLAALTRACGGRLTILEPDPQRREHAALALGEERAELRDQTSTLPVGAFDVIVSAGSFSFFHDAGTLISELAAALVPAGLLLAVEPVPSLFHDLVFGTDESWFASNSLSTFPVGRLQAAEDWRRLFGSAGFEDAVAQRVETGAEAATFLVARGATNAVRREAIEDKISVSIVAGSDPKGAEIAGRMRALLEADGHRVAVEQRLTRPSHAPPEAAPGVIVHIGDCFGKIGLGRRGSPLDAVRDRCMELKSLIEKLKPRDTRLWTITSNAFDHEADAVEPVEAAYWAFTRTIANEYPGLNIRRVELSPRLSAQQAASRIKDLIVSAGDETEIVLDANSTGAVRIERLSRSDEVDTGFSSAASLERGHHGGLDSLSWRAAERMEAGPDEIEIEVEATGLNFRDVMWGLSMLPDEVLEDGFAGPCLGLECAGRVVRVGQGVRDFQAGDRVVALARSAFATHVIVPSWAAMLVPPHMSAEAAATIPVAFATAYYALVTLARIRRDEWLLIHGGAGGVGLAALQIAQWRGARVIATAGSQEKRDLLRLAGADHALDSRNTGFVDRIREITGDGVDAVLNSLSSEAMERSIGALRPFGRFLELGKRDYVTNTHIGLRPFRRNVTYFGIDLDQILKARPHSGSRILARCRALLETGAIHPLPYCGFAADEVIEAFRLMQQSGHIGKIIVAPPKIGPTKVTPKVEFVVDPDKTHLITGAFSGFGLETARWLAHRGARHIVMLGRRGPADPAAQALLAELRASGVVTLAEACDVSDLNALRQVFRNVAASLPPLAGTIHAAMVLADATVGNLTDVQMETVLRPKILGAENLDTLTRGLELDYFILYSSATTLIGNPGQASYVAANAYLEGLARRRNRQGLPAHAIAWGAIGDTGVLARNRGVHEQLAQRVGVNAMQAHQALDLMAQALSWPVAAPDDSVLALASLDWSAARAHLPILTSPTYQTLGRDRHARQDPETAVVDLRSLIETDGIDHAREAVLKLVVEEVSRVLRMPKEHVSLVRPLSEVGLDSLMAVELATSLRERVGGEAQLSATASGLTVAELGQQLLALAGGARGERMAVSADDQAPQNHAPQDLAPQDLAPQDQARKVDIVPSRRLG